MGVGTYVQPSPQGWFKWSVGAAVGMFAINEVVPRIVRLFNPRFAHADCFLAIVNLTAPAHFGAQPAYRAISQTSSLDCPFDLQEIVDDQYGPTEYCICTFLALLLVWRDARDFFKHFPPIWKLLVSSFFTWPAITQFALAPGAGHFMHDNTVFAGNVLHHADEKHPLFDNHGNCNASVACNHPHMYYVVLLLPMLLMGTLKRPGVNDGTTVFYIGAMHVLIWYVHCVAHLKCHSAPYEEIAAQKNRDFCYRHIVEHHGSDPNTAGYNFGGNPFFNDYVTAPMMTFVGWLYLQVPWRIAAVPLNLVMNFLQAVVIYVAFALQHGVYGVIDGYLEKRKSKTPPTTADTAPFLAVIAALTAVVAASVVPSLLATKVD